MVDLEEVERIQFRMRRIRKHMDVGVDRIQADAAQLFDWRYYIARHPVASLGAVIAAGFFLVPSSAKPTEEKVYLDPEVSRELVNSTQRVEVNQPEEKVKQGVLVSLGALALNTLFKVGVNYATQQVRTTLLKDFQPARATSRSET